MGPICSSSSSFSLGYSNFTPYLILPVLLYLPPLLLQPAALLLLPELVDHVEEVGLVVVDARDLVLELARLLPLLVRLRLVRLKLLEQRPERDVQVVTRYKSAVPIFMCYFYLDLETK